MKSVALYDDGSKYCGEVRVALVSADVETKMFASSARLQDVLDDDLDAVILVNPHVHLANAVRGVMSRAGGWFLRIPVLGAVADRELLADVNVLSLLDDFIVAPTDPVELVLRSEVQSLKHGASSNSITAGDLVIDLEAHRIMVGGKPVDFTHKEFELLRTLASTPGRAYSREDLLKTIWGYDYFGGTRTVDVHVRRLRSKIEGSRRYIETVHGVGYRFVD